MNQILRTKLSQLKAEIEENRDAISTLKSHDYDLEIKREELLNQILLEAKPELVGKKLTHDTEWEWGCDKSPTGLCVYDDKNDPAHDQCLCCGDPNERK